jgi:hypothetical protein
VELQHFERPEDLVTVHTLRADHEIRVAMYTGLRDAGWTAPVPAVCCWMEQVMMSCCTCGVDTDFDGFDGFEDSCDSVNS